MTGKRKRPRDFSQAAKLVVDIATGQVADREPTPRGTRIPLAKLTVGESHTIEGQRLEVNESLTRYQRELA